METPDIETMEANLKKAADSVVEALKEHLPNELRFQQTNRHEILSDFALVRNWAELCLRDRRKAKSLAHSSHTSPQHQA